MRWNRFRREEAPTSALLEGAAFGCTVLERAGLGA